MKSEDKILNIINELESQDVIIVLKGFSNGILNKPEIDLEDLMNNKKDYFKKIMQGKKIVSYEEFIIFRNSILEFYDQVIIIDNNLYNNIYPLNATISKSKSRMLEEYFDLEYETELEKFEHMDQITDYLSIYGDYKRISEKDYIVYTSSVLEKDEKISYINIYEKTKALSLSEVSSDEEIIEIINEEDYIVFLDNLKPGKKYFIKKATIDLAHYSEKLELINECFRDIKFVYANVKEEEKYIEKYDEYLSILQKYWKYDDFFKIPNYDLAALEEGAKKTKDISQAEIIDTIVLEAEKAISSKKFNDIFVTAPTGSGKSAIFQIPAIYIGEKHKLMTIVISPLIGLMNDQIKGLEKREYNYVQTIHSDISPVKKQEIMDDIDEGKCHILYISPETLLSRGDVSQLIGSRKIGLFVIDEAHIVTTWGKQFRPDYWFLGDHLDKMRKKQRKEIGHDFPIATFTATAIYGGVEDMYSETVESLNLSNPKTYLGYIKRENIDIKVKEVQVVKNKEEYQLDKFESILKNINSEFFQGRKTLVYFPTVKLINSFSEFMYSNKRGNIISKYHGQMGKAEKQENYEMFYSGEKKVMLATKAFGMGIDIEDILNVIHFAPTGNVCDYVQEIGRAARKKELVGKAYYEYMSNDFKYINRFHGVSLIKKYQLVQVIEKIHDLFINQLAGQGGKGTGKKASMLLDAESFSHIFQNDFFDNDDAINKVKTAMLIIQKDFENKLGYSPIYMRPIPIFNNGYFYVRTQESLKDIMKEYGSNCKIRDKEKNIIDLNLGYIWERKYKQYTFPYFKYMLYSKSEELDFKYKHNLTQALIVDIEFTEHYRFDFNKSIKSLEDIVYEAVKLGKYYSDESLTMQLASELRINKFKANIIIDSFLTTMKYFAKEHSKRLFGRMYNARESSNNKTTYKFTNQISEYFKWIKNSCEKLENDIIENKLYIVNDNNNAMKEVLLFLGLMESFGLLSFKSLGGSNSQIYLHINQTQHLKNIINNPHRYTNKILSTVDNRHKVSVTMLTYLFGNEFTSDQIWDYIEDYFLGIIPEEVSKGV